VLDFHAWVRCPRTLHRSVTLFKSCDQPRAGGKSRRPGVNVSPQSCGALLNERDPAVRSAKRRHNGGDAAEDGPPGRRVLQHVCDAAAVVVACERQEDAQLGLEVLGCQKHADLVARKDALLEGVGATSNTHDLPRETGGGTAERVSALHDHIGSVRVLSVRVGRLGTWGFERVLRCKPVC
jgi:hypothetical protein